MILLQKCIRQQLYHENVLDNDWSSEFYGYSTFVVYSTPNPFLFFWYNSVEHEYTI